MTEEKKMSGKFLAFVGILLLIIVIGVVAVVIRWTTGLGPEVTGLSDDFPWGMWLAFDDLTGVAIASGSFLIAAMVYIFRLKKYEPIVLPAILTGFIGYILVVSSLVLDLGQPERFWHPLIMWQMTSVLFAVFWFAILYTVVLVVWLIPVVMSRKEKKVKPFATKMLIPLAFAGAIIGTLHQSALGGMYTLAVGLNPLWYSQMLPVLFFISAIAAGLSMVMLESIISAKAMKRKGEGHILPGIAKIVGVLLLIYLIIRFVDVAANGGLSELSTSAGTMFLLEIVLVIIPMIIFLMPNLQKNTGAQLFGGLLVIGSILANRWNLNITARVVPEGASYSPTWIEWAITIGLVALGVLLYTIAVKMFPIFPSEPAEVKMEEPAEEEELVPVDTPSPLSPDE